MMHVVVWLIAIFSARSPAARPTHLVCPGDGEPLHQVWDGDHYALRCRYCKHEYGNDVRAWANYPPMATPPAPPAPGETYFQYYTRVHDAVLHRRFKVASLAPEYQRDYWVGAGRVAGTFPQAFIKPII